MADKAKDKATADSAKAIQTLHTMESIIRRQMEEKRQEIEWHERSLLAQADEARVKIITQGAKEIEWKEVRIENTSKAKEKADYSYTMLCGWSGLACAQKNEFAVNWCEEIKTVTIPYLEYKDELYFLYAGQHAEGSPWGLPYITVETLSIALKTNVVVKIDTRYLELVYDMMDYPNVYFKKLKEFFKSKENVSYRYEEIAEYLLASLDE
ncbi:MAG: hypothetical protein IKY94_06990 [Lachnospiraceae bacterium]|nr:hypothetical protein [Lachnospiraceae bacterium]